MADKETTLLRSEGINRKTVFFFHNSFILFCGVCMKVQICQGCWKIGSVSFTVILNVNERR